MAEEVRQYGASMTRVGFRLGLIGAAGSRARYGSVLSSTPGIRVVGIADPETRIAQAMSKMLHSRPSNYSHPAAMFEAGLDLDGLAISTGLPLRSAALYAAAQAAIPTVTEFPMSVNSAEEAEITAAYAARQLVLMPTLPRRFDPHFALMFQSMHSDSIGVLRQARCDWSLPFVEAEERPGGLQSAALRWRSSIEQVAREAIDVGRWWFGEATSVSADLGTEQGALAINNPVNAKNLYKSSAAGAVGTIIVTHAFGQFTHRFALSRSLQGVERYTVLGSLGHLELVSSGGDAQTSSSAAVTLHRIGRASMRLRPQDSAWGIAEGLSGMLVHFADCVIAGAKPLVTIEDARIASEVFEAAVRSSEERCRISLPLLLR